MADLIKGMPNTAYHANAAFGSSMVRDFLKNRERCFRRYILRDIEPEASSALRLGELAHLRILEPEAFLARVAPPAPEAKRTTKAGKAEWADYEERYPNLIMCKQAELDQLEGMARGVQRNPLAAELLYARSGKVEASAFWDDEKTGLPLKCRFDWLATISADLKTTTDASPSAFKFACGKYRYDLQKWHYLQSNKTESLLHIVIEKNPPYTCAVYDVQVTDHAKKQWRKAIDDLAECLERGAWLNPWQKCVTAIEISPWHTQEDSDDAQD